MLKLSGIPEKLCIEKCPFGSQRNQRNKKQNICMHANKRTTAEIMDTGVQ